MKRWLSKEILAATIVLPALSGAAWAGGSDDFGCSSATLKGEYAFGVTAYTPAGLPNGPPQVVAGIKVFDGNGNLTQRDYIGDGVPAEFAPSGQEKGTYAVNSDCTGSMVINLNVPPSFLPPGTSTGVIDQRWRPSYPRSRFAVDPAWLHGTPTHPNQRRRLEGRIGAGALNPSTRLRDLPRWALLSPRTRLGRLLC